MRKNNKVIENIVSLILEYRILKHLPRTCLSYLKDPVKENVAEHTLYPTFIAWL
jgi:5'-deoxynucleotidase YfbR-like HD superfamily hydrolase